MTKNNCGVSRYTKLIKSLLEAGYEMKDIDEIINIRVRNAEERREISEQCAAEGYPSHGSNYELRVEEIDEYYNELEEEIHDKYRKDEDYE